MSMILGAIYGAFGMGFLMFIIGAAAGLFFFMDQMSKNKWFIIRNITQGVNYFEIYRGKIKKLKSGDTVYYIPALRKESRHYIPINSTADEVPAKGNKSVVCLTHKNGTYFPERFNEFEEVDIEKVIRDKDNNSWKTVTERVTRSIIQPIKTSLRSSYLKLDKIIQEESGFGQDFWAKYGHVIIPVAMLGTTLVLCIMFIIFTIHITQNPSAIQPVLDAAQNIAPSTTG